MDDCVDRTLSDVRGNMEGTATSPAVDRLCNANSTNPEPLLEEDAKCFHTMTAKSLFLSKRARPDVQQGVAFLTTRAKGPDKDDCEKLSRVIECLRADPRLALTLEADDVQTVKWWFDASFAVHPDMKSHTGATMSIGEKGSQCTTFTRQKLNAKSSTEAELVGVSDMMPMVLWTRHFLEAQGHKVNNATMHQDNQSAMLLEKNGRASSGKRTRHVNIQCFFIADGVRSKEVSVEHCPMEHMLADCLTKPPHGVKFIEFRSKILNIQLQRGSVSRSQWETRTPTAPIHRSVFGGD